MVYRPWGEAELLSASLNLPHPVQDSNKFHAEFLTFCEEFRPSGQEIRRLLVAKLKPTELAKISSFLPSPDLRPEFLEKEKNTAYNNAVKSLAEEIQKNFPAKVNMSVVFKCKQEANESTDAFIQRLTELFDRHSGLKQSDHRDTHLSHAILRGLRPEIADFVKNSYIGGLEEPRLDEVTRYARHACMTLQEKARQKELQKDEDLHAARLTLYSAAVRDRSPHERRSDPRRHSPRARTRNGQGRHSDQNKWQRRSHGTPRQATDSDRCFTCGNFGHFARDCPDSENGHVSPAARQGHRRRSHGHVTGA